MDQTQPQHRDDDKWLIAWILLLLLLGASALRPLTLSQQRKARTLLRDKFNNDAVRLAAAITSGAVTLDAWQAGLAQASGDYARTMAVAGAGTMPSADVQDVVEQALAEQSPFLDGFAAVVAVGALSVAQVAARSKMYGGVGWSAHWQGAEQGKIGQQVIVHYVAHDDDRACEPCLAAERGGPYRVGEAPIPGSVCLGGGYCRCELHFEVNPGVYAAMTGQP